MRTLLSQADDREFVAALRAPSSQQVGSGARLDRLMGHVTELKARIDEAGLDGALATRFKTRLDEVSNTLNALRTDRPLHERAAKVAGLHVLLAPLPLIILLVTKPRQQKTESEIAALMAKALVEGIVMVRTPTMDNNLLKDRAIARCYPNMVQAFRMPTWSASFGHHSEKMRAETALHGTAPEISTNTPCVLAAVGERFTDCVVPVLRACPI